MIHYRSRSSLPRRRLIASAVVLLLAGFSMLTPAFAAEPKVLIGLGDSYASGLGNANTGSCGRSEIAFPTLAAQWLEAQGTNFACSGATAESFDQPFDGQSPQLDLLRQAEATTGVDYVALTAGGNDVGVLRGVAGLLNGTALPSFGEKIEAEVPNLTSTYKDIRTAAPNADVYVLGYPNIFPTENPGLAACIGTDFGGRVDMANGVAAFNLMNSGIETAVKATGDPRVHFVAVDTFAGHDFCSSDPWAYGLTGRGLLHPNEAGHDEMARLLANAINETPAPPASTSNSTTSSTSTSSTMASTSTSASSTVAPTSSTSTSTSTTAVGLQELPVTPAEIVPISSAPTTSSTSTSTTVAISQPELAEITTTTVAQSPASTVVAPTSTTTTAAPRTTPTSVAPTTSTTSTSTAPVAPAVSTSTTTTAAPEVLAESVQAPTLAYTGSSTLSHLAIALVLTGIGLGLLWLRLVQRDRMARMVIPVKVKR